MLLGFQDMDTSLRPENTKTYTFQCFLCFTLDINLSRVRPAQVLKQIFTAVTEQAQMFIPSYQCKPKPLAATGSIRRCFSWKRRNQSVA